MMLKLKVKWRCRWITLHNNLVLTFLLVGTWKTTVNSLIAGHCWSLPREIAGWGNREKTMKQRAVERKMPWTLLGNLFQKYCSCSQNFVPEPDMLNITSLSYSIEHSVCFMIHPVACMHTDGITMEHLLANIPELGTTLYNRC